MQCVLRTEVLFKTVPINVIMIFRGLALTEDQARFTGPCKFRTLAYAAVPLEDRR
jgi:hypothetical protein